MALDGSVAAAVEDEQRQWRQHCEINLLRGGGQRDGRTQQPTKHGDEAQCNKMQQRGEHDGK